jgi:DNA-binding HxlR family transcriptional regulator
MLGRSYQTQNCSAARALEVVGERWSLLIIRDALFLGISRFSEFERSLGVAPNILASRLQSFVRWGLMELSPQNEGAEQPGYVLTQKGRDLAPAVVALAEWGDRWAAPEGPPIEFRHGDCTGEIRQHTVCDLCGVTVAAADLQACPGPGARPSTTP